MGSRVDLLLAQRIPPPHSLSLSSACDVCARARAWAQIKLIDVPARRPTPLSLSRARPHTHRYTPLRGAAPKYGSHPIDQGTGFPDKFMYYEFSDMHIFAAYLHPLSPSSTSCTRGKSCVCSMRGCEPLLKGAAASVGPGRSVLIVGQSADGPLRFAMKIPNEYGCSVPLQPPGPGPSHGAPRAIKPTSIVGAHFQGKCKAKIASFLRNVSLARELEHAGASAPAANRAR